MTETAPEATTTVDDATAVVVVDAAPEPEPEPEPEPDSTTIVNVVEQPADDDGDDVQRFADEHGEEHDEHDQHHTDYESRCEERFAAIESRLDAAEAAAVVAVAAATEPEPEPEPAATETVVASGETASGDEIVVTEPETPMVDEPQRRRGFRW